MSKWISILFLCAYLTYGTTWNQQKTTTCYRSSQQNFPERVQQTMDKISMTLDSKLEIISSTLETIATSLSTIGKFTLAASNLAFNWALLINIQLKTPTHIVQVLPALNHKQHLVLNHQPLLRLNLKLLQKVLRLSLHFQKGLPITRPDLAMKLLWKVLQRTTGCTQAMEQLSKYIATWQGPVATIREGGWY